MTSPPQPQPTAAFDVRSPSQTWEQIPLDENPQHVLWVWFKPAHLPQGLILRVPEEMYQYDPQFAQSLTLRIILSAAQIDANSCSTWSVQGHIFDTQHGKNPLIDQPLPGPVSGIDPSIYVAVHATQGMPIVDESQMPSGNTALPTSMANAAANPSQLALLENMEACWSQTQQFENDMQRLRQLCVDMITKLKTLNRDLNNDERMHSNSQDKKDWQDCRRWLRDCEGRLSRCVKDHDIGYTSSAGQRNRFEKIYNQFVLTKTPFNGMEQTFRDFEVYQKVIQNLASGMKFSQQYAAQNGERRAQRVLNTIAAKVRAANTKKNFLGVIVDS